MTLLWINLALVFIFAFFARYSASTGITIIATAPVASIKPNKMLMFAALLTLTLVSGLRSNIGDTFNYKNIYVDNDFTWDYILGHKDIGFGILQMLLKKLSADPQLMIFTAALITNVLIVFILYKYSRQFELSLYVYITGGLFLVSMNGIRQVLAAAITFTAIKFLINGNWKRYVLVVLLASLFHQSALILIPMYFIVRFKAWSKATIALVLLSIVGVIGYDQLSSIFFSAIEDTQYGDYKDFNEGGASSIRVLVSAVPLLIAYLGRGKLRKIFPDSDVIVNMTLLGFVFMVISTQSWIFARVSIYFGLYQLILISWIVKLFRGKDEKFVYYGILVLYFAYYYYENVISLEILYKSNYLVW
ncbi:EpsG family protein [Peribacillus cavernae]|uniref:EpsG family protein n=1 Tax=Peribacillus cavernae TaxID=1674310 RepID=A0A3S0U4T8_9BACI|nr:EpsG family protein [Peribacillus cavernae]MDQ0217493.1 transmembrane protein EpsG [Peribacillus cavernae]RUQ30066.1 EpsG family protein [Peribacillus cavernae]